MKGWKLNRAGGRWALLALLGLVGVAAYVGRPTHGQAPQGFNERKVDKAVNAEDRRDETGKPVIWMLDFHFKDPRVIKVNVAGRGERNVWYLWYQVSNNTGEERKFNPDFVWVCHDTNTVHQDQILHEAQNAIVKFEDPSNLLDIKNSVTIGLRPIPVSKEFENGMRIAYPKLITGIAMFDDVDPRSDQFSIFVYGLSDGWSVVDGPDGKPIVRRKTLQLKFKRLGDEFNPKSSEIRYVGHEWIYATSDLPAPPAIDGKPMAEPNKPVPVPPKPELPKPAPPKPEPAKPEPPKVVPPGPPEKNS